MNESVCDVVVVVVVPLSFCCNDPQHLVHRVPFYVNPNERVCCRLAIRNSRGIFVLCFDCLICTVS